MGGRIWVESEPGGRQHVPLHRRRSARRQAGLRTAQFEALADLPVLVVDDNAVNRRIFSRRMLRRWRMRPTAVADGGQSALEAPVGRRRRRAAVRARAARRQHA